MTPFKNVVFGRMLLQVCSLNDCSDKEPLFTEMRALNRSGLVNICHPKDHTSVKHLLLKTRKITPVSLPSLRLEPPNASLRPMLICKSAVTRKSLIIFM